MRCEYAHDDGAYVLGALSPAERSAYERHLGSCPACREAVAEIAVLPGLLGRLDTATALQLLAEDEPAPQPGTGRVRPSGAGPGPLRPPGAGTWGWPASKRDGDDDARMASLLDATARQRRRDRRNSRLRYATTALAAACAVVLAMVGLGALRDAGIGGTGGPNTGPGVRMEAMSPTDGQELPVTAEVGLESRSWGTEVTMECAYQETDRYRKAWRLQLVAYGAGNESEQVGSWIAAPGESVSFTGATRFSGDELVRLALTRPDGTQLLTYDVP